MTIDPPKRMGNHTFFFCSGRETEIRCSSAIPRPSDGMVLVTTEDGYLLLQHDELAAIIPTEQLTHAPQKAAPEGAPVAGFPVALLERLYPHAHMSTFFEQGMWGDRDYLEYSCGHLSPALKDALKGYVPLAEKARLAARKQESESASE